MTDDLQNRIQTLAQWLYESMHLVVFTGAGILTESGIPDYRSKGGIWDKFRPVYFDEFMVSKEARIEYWRRKAYRDFYFRPQALYSVLSMMSFEKIIELPFMVLNFLKWMKK